ncbi:MAG: RNA polymerase sigma-70 factor [Dysgonamonadaceae bacterium]|jgi:RNA polymerase sigma-70 factor (ECF subfamily)|nr:RNA polymerase sigma-70 factor [Dysgonamonadaceae bacterium]
MKDTDFFLQENESDYIRQLKNGQSKAFDAIYQMYAKRLYAYSFQFTKSKDEAEDIVQEVFVKLWINREKIKQEDTLRSLLFIMAKHHIINAFHSRINQPAYMEYLQYRETLSENDNDPMNYREFLDDLKKAMKTLPTTQQKVIVLSKIQELPNKKIAEKLELSEQTVKNALSAGLKNLKKILAKAYLVLLSVNFLIIMVLCRK